VNTRQNFIFNEIQKGFFDVRSDNSISFKLIRYGRYIELSIQNIVVLTLIDYMYSGDNLGIYACSSQVTLRHSVLSILPDPVEEYAGQKEAQKI
jgi:beta-fructofuranosidase